MVGKYWRTDLKEITSAQGSEHLYIASSFHCFLCCFSQDCVAGVWGFCLDVLFVWFWGFSVCLVWVFLKAL